MAKKTKNRGTKIDRTLAGANKLVTQTTYLINGYQASIVDALQNHDINKARQVYQTAKETINHFITMLNYYADDIKKPMSPAIQLFESNLSYFNSQINQCIQDINRKDEDRLKEQQKHNESKTRPAIPGLDFSQLKTESTIMPTVLEGDPNFDSDEPNVPNDTDDTEFDRQEPTKLAEDEVKVKAAEQPEQDESSLLSFWKKANELTKINFMKGCSPTNLTTLKKFILQNEFKLTDAQAVLRYMDQKQCKIDIITEKQLIAFAPPDMQKALCRENPELYLPFTSDNVKTELTYGLFDNTEDKTKNNFCYALINGSFVDVQNTFQALVKKVGDPKNISSDNGKLFLNKITHIPELRKRLGIDIKFIKKGASEITTIMSQIRKGTYAFAPDGKENDPFHINMLHAMNSAIAASRNSWAKDGKSEKITELTTLRDNYINEPSDENIQQFLLRASEARKAPINQAKFAETSSSKAFYKALTTESKGQLQDILNVDKNIKQKNLPANNFQFYKEQLTTLKNDKDAANRPSEDDSSKNTRK